MITELIETEKKNNQKTSLELTILDASRSRYELLRR
jgi:hypothetical protein